MEYRPPVDRVCYIRNIEQFRTLACKPAQPVRVYYERPTGSAKTMHKLMNDVVPIERSRMWRNHATAQAWKLSRAAETVCIIRLSIVNPNTKKWKITSDPPIENTEKSKF